MHIFRGKTAVALLAAACLGAGFAAGTQVGRVKERLRVRTRKVVFSGPHTFTLAGRVHYPPRFPWSRHPGILFVHGTLPSGKDTALYRLLLPALARKGYLVLSFDLRGFGESYKISRFRVPQDLDFVTDTRAALDYMLARLPVRREEITVAGHSLGGNLSFIVGATSPEVRNIVSIAPGNYKFPEAYPPAVRRQYMEKLERAVGQPVGEEYWMRLVRPLNLFQYLPIEGPKNVYFILADGDWPDVRRYTENLFEQIETPKGLVIVPHANHNFGTEYDTGNEVVDPRPIRTLAAEIDTLIDSASGR
ncbi:MAG: alpha/beta fold hydrolase [bacterium]|nr:alpha/beta fold hydrolase [bacterium]